METTIRVVLSSDRSGMRWNATLIASIMRRASVPVKIRMYTRGFREESFSSGPLTVEFVHAEDDVSGRYPAHVSDAVFDRLKIIRDEDTWERVLILDHDMIALCDLAPYFEEDFEGNLLMGRLLGPRNTLGLQMAKRGGLPSGWQHCEDHPYFYMGPMMNLALMRKEGTWDKLLKAHREIGQDEQISLTAATGGRVKGVANRWNLVPQWDLLEELAANLPMGRSQVAGIEWFNRCPEGIIHWSESQKPWQRGSKVWRPDLWQAEKVTWEHLRRGMWEKPRALEYGPDRKATLGLLSRGWRVAVDDEEDKWLPHESFPDLSFSDGQELPGSFELIRLGVQAKLESVLQQAKEGLPETLVVSGPRSQDDIARLRKSGYRFEARIERQAWPLGGPHPAILEYYPASKARALSFHEDGYFSRNPLRHRICSQIGSTRSDSPSAFIQKLIWDSLSSAADQKRNSVLELGDGRYLGLVHEVWPDALLSCLTHDALVAEHLASDPGCRVMHAPLREDTGWYDLSGVPVPAADLLIVNGPDHAEAHRCAAGALALLGKIAPDALILLAGTNQKQKRKVLPDWREAGCRVIQEGFDYCLLRKEKRGPNLQEQKQKQGQVQHRSTNLTDLAHRAFCILHPTQVARKEIYRREWMERTSIELDFVTAIKPDLRRITWHSIKGFEAHGSQEILQSDYLENELIWKQGLIEAIGRFLESGEQQALFVFSEVTWSGLEGGNLPIPIHMLPESWDLIVLHAQGIQDFKPVDENLIQINKMDRVGMMVLIRKTALILYEELVNSDCELNPVIQRLLPDWKGYGLVPFSGKRR